MSIRRLLRLTVLEDLHSGTGTGRGDLLDAVQICDRNGRPVIRATHFKGLLLEAARDLSRLDVRGADGAPVAPLDRISELFGKRGGVRAKLLVRSFRLDPDSRPSFRVWTSTARRIDPLSGLPDRAPNDDTLRTVQYVSAGAVFVGELVLVDPSLLELLTACLRRVDHVGSRRRRGGGRVRIELTESPANGADTSMPAANHRRLRLVLRALDPVCLPITGFPGNVIPTESYIRGQTLRGALAECIHTNGADVGVVLSRQVSVGNAYPLPKTAQVQHAVMSGDVMPVPLLLGHDKPPGATTPDWPWWADEVTPDWPTRYHAHSSADGTDEGVPKRKRPPDAGYVYRDNESPWYLFKPEIALHMRNQVPRFRGDRTHLLLGEKDEALDVETLDEDERLDEELHDEHEASAPVVGKRRTELFAAEEIAENTMFLAEVEIAEDAVAGAVHTLHTRLAPVLKRQQWLAVGRGGRPMEVAAAVWCEPALAKRHGTPGANFTLTLESDLIARGPYLGFVVSLDLAVLAQLAEMNEEETTVMVQSARLVKSICDTVEVRGFNYASGLPRSSALAVRRGSTVVIENAAGVGARLAKMPYLGERGNEGFGRFRLDFAPLAHAVAAPSAPARDGETKLLAARDPLFATAKRLAHAISLDSSPSLSQWHQLRERVWLQDTPDDLLKVLTKLERASEERKGGRSWREANLPAVRAEIAELAKLGSVDDMKARVDDMKTLIDAMVRWIRVRMRAGRGNPASVGRHD